MTQSKTEKAAEKLQAARATIAEKGREAIDKGKEVFDSAKTKAQENPLKAAAIGAGVVAAVGAAAYGASKLRARRNGEADDAEQVAISPDAADGDDRA